jgi:hypothetical protein
VVVEVAEVEEDEEAEEGGEIHVDTAIATVNEEGEEQVHHHQYPHQAKQGVNVTALASQME